MRGLKLTIAIITIILASVGLLVALFVGLLAFGFLGDNMPSYGYWANGWLDNHDGQVLELMIYSLLFGLTLSILFLILGIMFCSRNRTKGVALTLLVFYILGVAVGIINSLRGDLIYIAACVLCGVMIILLIVYLANSGGRQPRQREVREPRQERQPKQQAQQPRYDTPPPQPRRDEIQLAERIAVTTESPNFAAKIINENLRFQATVSGGDVIVNTRAENAQRIADELQRNGIKVLRMRRI